MIEHTEEIKLKDKQISEKCGELELKEKHIHESLISLDSKVEHINKRCEELSLREKLISDRSKALDLKEKKIYEQSQALEVKEKEISRHAKAEELGERQRDVHIKALVLKGKKISKCFQEQECKKNEINDPCTKLELKREQLSETSGMKKKSEQNSSLGFGEGLQSLTLKQCVTDGKALQMFLNDRVDEHRFMEEEIRDALRLSSEPGRLVLAACVGFFSPHLKNGDVMYETSAVRSSCVLLLEQLMILKHKVDEGLKKNAKKVFFLWKEKMREDGESRIVVLSFLLLIVAYGLSSIVDKDELQRLYEIVDQDRIAPRLHQELDLFKANEGSNMATAPLELTTGQQQTDKLQGTDTVASSSINHCSVIHSLCHRMDAKGLRLYIREHLIEQIISPEKILGALRYAPDPAKLLLNVVQIFNQPKATPVEKANCIFLLEQLMKLLKQQPSINSLGQVEQLVKPPSKFTLGLRKQAKQFAYIWKQTLAKKGYKLLEVYGFLQFLATYEIASLFNEDELFRLFKKCYGGHLVFRPEQNPYLCRTLGLEKRISGLIKSLVKEDRRLQAVKYICTFMMESYFPLAPLLKDHLKFTKEKSVKFRKERNNSHAAKIESARFEMRHLQDVLKYINDFALESEFTDVSLELRIEELEKQIAELNTSTTEVEQMVTTEEGLKDDISVNLEVDMVKIGSTKLRKKGKMNLLHPADTADTSSELFSGKKRTSSPSPSFVLPQEKRLKAGAFESPVLPNRQWPQPGPCTSGHQAHVKPDELPVSHPVTLPAVYVSSTQSGFPDNSYGASATPTPYRETQQITPTAGICPGGIDVQLKTTTAGAEQKLANERKEDLKNTFSANIEKNIVENNSTQSVKKAEKILSPAFSEIVAESCGEKYFSIPSSSSVLPQQAKHLRPQTLESPNPPPNYPITSMNPPLPSLQPSGQHRPYTFGHVAHDGPNGLTALHPGQMPTVNGPSAHFGGPSGGSYGVTPYWGTGEFKPTGGICPSGTPVPQPAGGIGLGSTPTPGQWPSACIGPGSTPGQYRPTAGIGPGSIPGQFRPTAGSYPDGPPAPRQFWPTVGISSGSIPAPGYFDGSQVPPYRP
uniref:FRIGIDA-like protein n=1 Tax=Chenopodium quinoa TaxID=63459 RepID=A0A803KPG1_CHEQI